MVSHSMAFRTAWALIVLGITLVLANWYTKPDSGLAWAAALAMFGVMCVALRFSPHIARGTTTTPAMAARGFDQITTSVMFAAIMMGIPLALTLARAYGVLEGYDELDRRSVGVLTSAVLVMIGNAMPKNLPPLLSGGDAARQQAFHRLAGWTWVLCGLASAVGWMTLPIDVAQSVAIALTVAAVALTVGYVVRLGRRVGTAPPLE